MAKRYARLNWNSTSTYVSPDNLNKMDKGIDDCDNAIENLYSLVGTLSSLTTTEKSNLVGAINEVKSGVNTLNNNFTGLQNEYRAMFLTVGATSYSTSIPVLNAINKNILFNSIIVVGVGTELDKTKFVVQKFTNSIAIYTNDATIMSNINGKLLGISFTIS